LDHIIIAFDEVSFQLLSSYKRIWFLKGEKPKGAFFWSNKKLLTFAALTSEHKFYYEFYAAQNSIVFCDFLKIVIEQLDKSKKYVFILDNAAFHKTQLVRDLIEEQSLWVKLEFIPPYSPELNPIETCWKVTKNAVTKSQLFQTRREMQIKLEEFWTKHIFMQEFITYLCP